MSFWADFEVILNEVAPIVLSFIPGVPKAIIPQVVKAMADAEATGVAGPVKLQAVIADSLNVAATVVPGLDAVGLASAVSVGVSSVITSINSIRDAKAALAPPVAAVPTPTAPPAA